MKRVLWVVLAVSLFSSRVPAYEADTLCGPRSLLMICGEFGVKTSLEELCALSGYVENKGTTMLGLTRAAKTKRLPALAVRMDLSDLCNLGKPCIVYVNDTHFFIVRKCLKDSVLVSESPQLSYTISKKRFGTIWKGEALIFSESIPTGTGGSSSGNTPPGQSPRIVFETTARDFGVVDEGAVLSHTYSFRNTGKGQLDITTRSSCGCTAALLSEKSIPPGGKGKIFVEFNTAGKHKGKNEVQIIVRSNDPGRKISTLKILATIRGRIAAIPDKVFLGEVGANSVVRREVLLRDAGDGVSKVIGVTVPEGVQAKILPARMDSTKSRIIPIQLTIRSGSLPGEISKYAVIRTNSGKQPEIPVQIYGTVASRIKVYPARIFFGDVAANATIRREATITPAEGMKIDPEKISAGDPRFITRITPLDGKSYRMSVTLTASGPEATLNDSIKLYLAGNSAPEIEIPIYARVVSKR